MKKERKVWFLATLILGFSPLTAVNSTEVHSVENGGTISFTGIYEPIGTPDPTPPSNIVSPPVKDITKLGEKFPQTNDLDRSGLFRLGVFMVSFSFLIWKRKKKQKKKLNY